jgi:hypothetical protein
MYALRISKEQNSIVDVGVFFGRNSAIESTILWFKVSNGRLKYGGFLRVEAEAGVFPCVVLISDQPAISRDKGLDYLKPANEGAWKDIGLTQIIITLGVVDEHNG